MSPDELRRELRGRRRTLACTEQAAVAAAIAERVVQLATFAAATHIAAYLAFDGEVDPSPLVAHAWRLGKRLYLPLLRDDGGLDFAPYAPDTPLAPNRFGIDEPVVDVEARLPATALDLVFAPLVGFDAAGGRLGMGGGFYDRSFAFLLDAEPPATPHLIGLAHDFQRVERLPRQPWDVPLTAIVTEHAVYVPPGAA